MSSNNSPDLLVLENLIVHTDTGAPPDRFDLTVKRGTVHVLFGDDHEFINKIIQIAAGFERPDQGRISFNGNNYNRLTPRKASRLGIEIVDHSFKGFSNLTVFDNIYAERWQGKPRLFHGKKHQVESAEKFFADLGLSIPLFGMMEKLSSTEQKVVEIARSILAGPRLLLLEESVLNAIQHNLKAGTIEKLKYLLTIMVENGMTVLLTSNDLDTIFSFAHNISVINSRKLQKTVPVNDIDKFQLVQMAYEFIVARKELERSNFELFYYKQVYQEIINGLPFPLLVTDTNKQVIIYNSEVRDMCFPEVEQPLLTQVTSLLPISDDQVRTIDKALLDFPASKVYTLEGVIENVKIFVTPVRDSFGSYMGMMYVFSRKELPIKLENEFFDHKKQQDIEYRINEIIHEVKNPLGIIINFLRLTKQEESIENIQGFASSIEKEVERINRLLNKLNRKNSPKDTRPQQLAVLPDLYDQTVEILKAVLEESNISLSIDRSHRVELPFDQDLLLQVVLNIMLNAAEAMPDGGILSVSNHTEEENDSFHVIITISDTGTGIAEEQIPHIFDPFYSTKEYKNSSGIGLSICREIIENFKGKIRVQSKLGKGAVFTIRLPLPEPASAAGDNA